MQDFILLFSVLFIADAIAGRILCRTIANPITLFCGLWGIITLAYAINPYGFYSASDKSLGLIYLGTICFFVGTIYVLIIKSKSCDLSFPTQLTEPAETPNYKLLIILNIISVIFLFAYGVQTIRLLMSGVGYDYIHGHYRDEEGLGSSSLSMIIFNMYVWPVVLGSVPILAVILQTDRKKSRWKTWFIITTLGNVALYVLISGARASIANLIVYFLLVYILRKKKLHFKSWQKFLLIIAIIGVLAAFNYLSTSRGSTSIINTLYCYLAGCIPCFSEKLSEINSDYMWGLASFYGFFRPILLVLTRLIPNGLLSNWRSLAEAIVTVTQEKIYIAPDIRYNAFVTPFYYFYRDAGTVGVAILSFVYGIFSMDSFIWYTKTRSTRSLVLYILVLYGLIFSMIRFQFYQMRYVFAFVYVLIVFSKGRSAQSIENRKNFLISDL